MARRFGFILATAVVALLVMTDGAWACRCMNRLINRCGHRRVCCAYVQPICCQPVTLPGCCQPVAGEPSVTTDSVKVEANKVPSTDIPILPPAPQVISPSETQVSGPPALKTREVPLPVKPEAKPEAKPELKLEPAPPKLVPVEVPAEPRVPAKPEISPIEPVKPDASKPDTKPDTPKPPDVAKTDASKTEPETVKPDTPKPEAPKPEAVKPDVPKPEAPKTEKPKDDPFGANDASHGLRMWADASGKYQIVARFVSFQDGTVRLQRANGRYVRIAYDLLCSVDQNFVINQDRSLLAME